MTCNCTAHEVIFDKKAQDLRCLRDGITIEPQLDGRVYVEVAARALSTMCQRMSSRSIVVNGRSVDLNYFRAMGKDPDEHVFTVMRESNRITGHCRTIPADVWTSIWNQALKRHVGMKVHLPEEVVLETTRLISRAA